MVITHSFEPPEHVPRTLARAQTCDVVSGRAPCVPRSREHEKRLAAGREKKIPKSQKTHFYIVLYIASEYTQYYLMLYEVYR